MFVAGTPLDSHKAVRVSSGLPYPVIAALIIAIGISGCTETSEADSSNAQQVATGKRIYEQHCAACHGVKLEGQPNWRERLPSGRLPAPPHDASGHTWHHPDQVLFGITRNGMAVYAQKGYASDMPSFAGQLSDNEIWATLAYIKSTWPSEVRALQAEVTRDRMRQR